MFQLPFFTALGSARRVLVAGAGGGFDLYCGLPLYFALRGAGKEVILANLSFTPLDSTTGRRLGPALVEVGADSEGPPYVNYFPEGYLCRWLRERGEEVSVYCFDRTGAGPLRGAYEHLLARHAFDTLLLVDGGTDSLMRGDEEGLGTPHEDVASLAATVDLGVERKLLACLGFGVDHYHGVSHFRYLEAVAELARAGAYLGAMSLTADMPEVREYVSAVRYATAAMPRHPSIVNTSIVSAVEGQYGDHHVTDRTAGSELWINPLMAMYWFFEAGAVARRVMYLEAMRATRDYDEVMAVVREWLALRPGFRPGRALPL